MSVTMEDLDSARAEVRDAAQTLYVQALVVGDVERAVELFNVARCGSLEEPILRELGFDDVADLLYPVDPDE